jgi:hypothetical protein
VCGFWLSASSCFSWSMTHACQASIPDGHGILDGEDLLWYESGYSRQQDLAPLIPLRISTLDLQLLLERKSPERVFEEEELRARKDHAPGLPLARGLAIGVKGVIFDQRGSNSLKNRLTSPRKSPHFGYSQGDLPVYPY